MYRGIQALAGDGAKGTGYVLSGRIVFGPSYSAFQPSFELVAKNSRRPMELFKAKGKNGSDNLKVGGYLIPCLHPLGYTLLALVGGGEAGPVFGAVNKISDAVRMGTLRVAVTNPSRPPVSTQNVFFLGGGFLTPK